MADSLVGRLAQIRRRLQRSPFAHTGDRQPERWVDAAPLLELDGEAFVRAAYLRILWREPDYAGLRYNTGQLLSGRMTKPELLTALAGSEEGQQYGVRFIGLDAAPLYRPFDSSPAQAADAFVRAVGRYYNGREPADDSLARWAELLEREKLSRDDVIRLFAASAKLSGINAISSDLADVRQALDWHQRALESLLSRQK